MLVENLKILAVVIGTLAVFTLVANSIPQVQSVVPEELSFGADVTESELTASGEILYGGAGGCTACHGRGRHRQYRSSLWQQGGRTGL
ncbi:uncharacterized protein METZ01_LOCUS251561 [marine metagenome]|uniref:Cytochrome c domain-containing protein n=1 Tax=marine metagenome TaxID=408172 RepID=A0A382IHJ4_9ZZZZ